MTLKHDQGKDFLGKTSMAWHAKLYRRVLLLFSVLLVSGKEKKREKGYLNFGLFLLVVGFCEEIINKRNYLITKL